MSFLRLLNPQGICGIAVSLALGILRVIQNPQTRPWKAESTRFAQLYRNARSASAVRSTSPP